MDHRAYLSSGSHRDRAQIAAEQYKSSHSPYRGNPSEDYKSSRASGSHREIQPVEASRHSRSSAHNELSNYGETKGSSFRSSARHSPSMAVHEEFRSSQRGQERDDRERRSVEYEKRYSERSHRELAPEETKHSRTSQQRASIPEENRVSRRSDNQESPSDPRLTSKTHSSYSNPEREPAAQASHSSSASRHRSSANPGILKPSRSSPLTSIAYDETDPAQVKYTSSLKAHYGYLDDESIIPDPLTPCPLPRTSRKTVSFDKNTTTAGEARITAKSSSSSSTSSYTATSRSRSQHERQDTSTENPRPRPLSPALPELSLKQALSSSSTNPVLLRLFGYYHHLRHRFLSLSPNQRALLVFTALVSLYIFSKLIEILFNMMFDEEVFVGMIGALVGFCIGVGVGVRKKERIGELVGKWRRWVGWVEDEDEGERMR